MKKVYSITEYQSFLRDKVVQGYKTLPADTFDALETFILSNKDKETDALELMGLSARKGVGKVITAKNYVGIITMKDGTSIEILPKIQSVSDNDLQKSKEILIKMLKTLKDAPFKTFSPASVNIEKMDIFEVFIRMFLTEVFRIVKHGLKCNYETIESNEIFYKGKMIFSKQIKYNLVHKERSYVTYDEFNVNRVENRLLKATLLYLYRVTNSAKNKNDIKTLLGCFAEVKSSTDYVGDFAKISSERNMKDYETSLKWCRVFLSGKSFTSFTGSEVAVALLFPMETLFESYIAVMLRRVLDSSRYRIRTQDKQYYLFDTPERFLMKPDIVIEDIVEKKTFIMDTKWKLLSKNKSNSGISQTDMYQMYTYQKKYNSENVTLLYPCTMEFKTEDKLEFSAEENVKVNVRFVDLMDIKRSLKKLGFELIVHQAEREEECIYEQ